MLNNNYTLLYAEDEQNVRTNYTNYLTLYFNTIYEAQNGQEALDKYYEYRPDIIILDVNMPLIDGLSVAKEIRKEDKEVSIIMLTAFSETDMLIDAISLQLIDYLIKPVNRTKLKNTIETAITYLDNKKDITIYQSFTHTIEYNKNKQKLFDNDIEIKLTHQERLLLEFLLKNEKKIVSKDEINYGVWQAIGENETDHNIKSLIKSLNKKFPEKIIEDIYSGGYRLDISSPKVINNSKSLLKQYQQITDKSGIVSVLDKNSIVKYVNDIFCEISGYKKDEIIGKDYHDLLKYRQPLYIHKDIWKTIGVKKEIWEGVLKFISRNGKVYFLKTIIKPILDENGNVMEFIAFRNDVTDIMSPKKQLDDTLKNAQNPVLIYMKLEEFSILQDIYDSSTIEHIQDNVLSILQANIPNPDDFEKIYQLGNGEYALIKDKVLEYDELEPLIISLKNYQNVIKENSIKVTDGFHYDVSILISLSFGTDDVLGNARYGIKSLSNKKENFIIVDYSLQEETQKVQDNLNVISILQKAISEFNIVSYFQPIVDNKTKEIEKYESLVRLIDNDDNVIPPAVFLEMAKKGKYYSQITSLVLDNSFEILNIVDTGVSVNISVLDIELSAIREKIYTLLEQNKDDAKRITFELLEDEDVKDFSIIHNFIKKVKSYGVKIAIDDFGIGYSNYERLLRFEPDILKIDGSLIKNIGTDTYSLSIVNSIVVFAKDQDIKIVAEYVENEEIFNIIKDLGIDYSQGYYFGKPESLQN